MTNKIITLFFLSILFNSCNVSKNIKTNQTDHAWQAEFEEFNGKETVKFNKQANSLVYLSSKLIANKGNLELSTNQKAISNTQQVNHTKLDLTDNLTIQVVGKKATGSFSLKYPIYENKKINIQYNKNIELFALAYFLISYEDYASIPDEQSFNIDGKNIKVKDLYAINLKIANEFKSYLNSKNLQVIKSYFDKKFYLQYSNLLLNIGDFPNAKIDSSTRFINEFSSLQDGEIFIAAFNNFFNEIRFNDFLENYKPYYNEMILEVTQNIPKQNFITEMEHFYGKKVANYNLYPSLTLSFSQGFGVGGENMVGNIFACFSKPEKINNPKALELGFNNETSIRTICIHEFGHSFINPVVDKVDANIIDGKSALFTPIKAKMSEQGYTEWKICLYEHFVRANEVIITRLLKDNQKADAILKDNYGNRSFIYLPQIIEQLEFWYYNEYFEKSYDEKVKEIITNLK